MASNVIALDVGEKRIGIAIANSEIPFPRPLTTIDNDADVWTELTSLIKENNVSKIVIGLPRNMQGEETKQSDFTRKFAVRLSKEVACRIEFQDESLTSIKAEQELTTKKKTYTKDQVDALAATYILEDYIGVNG